MNEMAQTESQKEQLGFEQPHLHSVICLQHEILQFECLERQLWQVC